MSDFQFTRANKMDTTLDEVREANVNELNAIVTSLMRKGERRNVSWWRIANILGITPGQVKRLFHCDWHDPPGSVLEFVRMRADQYHAEGMRRSRLRMIGLLQEIAEVEEGLNANPLVTSRQSPDGTDDSASLGG